VTDRIAGERAGTVGPGARFGSRGLFERALELSLAFRESLDGRAPASSVSMERVRDSLGALGETGLEPEAVLEELAAAVEPGLVANAGPRWLGFVTGGSLPVAVAAEWLTSAWDQNAGLVVLSPAAAAVEQLVGGWVCELVGLPAGSGVGFVTGGQAASFTALAAARHALLGRVGHDVERDGLWGAPRVNVVVGEEAHATVFAALRLLGLGDGGHCVVGVDGQGRMRVDRLREVLAADGGPTLVCVQAGNVATGAFDLFGEIADAAEAHGSCWVHVDGAFGLWVRASSRLGDLAAGVERADSWTLDAHKWLNVPYDSGVVVVRDRVAHVAAMRLQAPYLVHGSAAGGENPTDFVPEASRRARGFVLYATLRTLGRRGVAEIVERSCRHALVLRDALAGEPGIEVLNEVVLNQVLVRFTHSDPGLGDGRTDAVIARVQEDGVCWVGGTTWQGKRAMRIALVNWSTTDHDIQRSIDSITTAAHAEPAT
jgi:glutamate/tyrosine decarboxylase-like PLP-dependent enzyme